MTKYARAGEIISSRIKKGKKAGLKVLKKNFFPFVLCWFLTAIVTFAAWGIYVFVDFAGFFLGIPLDFLGAGIWIFTTFPMFAGNVAFSKRLIKGGKTDISILFEGYFNPKGFWTWALCYLVSLSPGWLLTLFVDVLSNETERFFPFLKGEWLFYVSVVIEAIMVLLFFLNLCKSLYLLSYYELSPKVCDAKAKVEKSVVRYSKRKKYFRRYILAHLHLIVIIILSRVFPLCVEAFVFTTVLGYFALCIPSFSEGFELKFKKYKSERSEKRYEKQ